MLGNLVASLRSELQWKLQGWVAEERTVRGFRTAVVNSRRDIAMDDVFARLDAALALIERYQPRVFRRLQHDFSRIHVARYPCRAAYFPDSKSCLIELTFSVNPSFTPAQVASSIVHEGMHARIHTMGVVYVPERRPREERMCREAELAFGLAIPDGEAVVRRAIESLQLDDMDVAPEIDWAEAQRAVAEADRQSPL
jgi:hypothetical protein